MLCSEAAIFGFMNIGVSAALLDEKRPKIKIFSQEIVTALATAHPEHTFHVFTDCALNTYPRATNVVLHALKPVQRNPIYMKYWLDVKLPKMLKKISAGVLLSTDGSCSLTSNMPQCLIVHDLSFLQNSNSTKKWLHWFYKIYTSKFLRKATHVIPVSEHLKKLVAERYRLSDKKTSVVYPGTRNIFLPLSDREKTSVKEKYTGGREYFLYDGDFDAKALIDILKAFSIFKKRLRSEMKMVFIADVEKSGDVAKLLQTYKYKDDVVLTSDVGEDPAPVAASSYAIVYMGKVLSGATFAAEVLRTEVPLLVPADSALCEIAGDAALYFDSRKIEDIADKLMLIYKDENLRSDLIKKGIARSLEFSWERSAEQMWKVLTAAAHCG